MADSQRRTMRRNIRELPRPAWILLAGNCINWFASFAIIFLALYLTKRGFSIPEAGGAVAAFGGGGTAAGLIAGHLADRFGRRTTMAVSMFASAATVLLLYFVRPYPALLALAFGAGLATNTWRPASRALMADVVPEGQRVTAFALTRFAGHVGYASGAAVAGFLADHSFLWVFVMDAATSVIFGLLVLLALPEGRRTTKSEDVERGGYATIAADKAFLLLFAASAFVAFIFAQQQSTLPLYVERILHLRPADFGLLISLNGVLVLAIELPISSVTMRHPPKQMMGIGFLLFGAGFALTAAAHSLLALLGTVAIWTLGEIVSAPVAYAYLADIAPEHLRGRYQGIYELAWGFGGVAGPALGAVLLAWSVHGLWAVCGALGLAASVLVLASPQRGLLVAEPTIVLPEAEPAAITPPL